MLSDKEKLFIVLLTVIERLLVSALQELQPTHNFFSVIFPMLEQELSQHKGNHLGLNCSGIEPHNIHSTGSTAHPACVHTQAGVSRPCAPLPTHVNSDLTTHVLCHSDKLLLHISDVTLTVYFPLDSAQQTRAV